MTQVGNALHSVFGSKNMDAIRARNAEIVVRCEEHGEFSHSSMQEFWMHPLRPGECPKCHMVKQERIQREQRLKAAVLFFRSGSGVPARFQEASLDNYRPENGKAQKILATLREYTAKFEQHRRLGLSLILCGKTGTGKTHLACAVLRELALTLGVCGKYSTAYKAVQEIRSSYKSDRVTELQALEEFIKPDILVLDEIGMQLGTDSEHLLLFSLLNGRYEELKPTIVISNLTLEEVKKYLNDRIYDRLRENGGGVLAFDWESYRTKVFRK